MSETTEKKYWTRYGIVTPKEAAQDLLDRAHVRLLFLEELIGLSHGGKGLALSEYNADGLASILKDIAHDIHEAKYYYYGLDMGEIWNPEPGKEGEYHGE